MAKREIISLIQVPKAWAREANQWRLYRTHTARPHRKTYHLDQIGSHEDG